MHNATHSFKSENKNMDGVSCPVCAAPVLPGPFDEQKDNVLPEYRELKKQYGKKFIQSECLRCKYVQRNECNNKAIDVFVCEKCNGASVDTWTKNIKYPAKPKTAITIGLEFDDKSKLKLRAIAKHAGALADELDRIDNLKECEACGSYKTVTESLIDNDTNNVISAIVKCDDCGNELSNRIKETTLSIGNASSKTGEVIADALKDLSARLKGSE